MPKYPSLDKIARFVLESEHGHFLKKMADAWIHADQENKAILSEAWAEIILKYRLADEYKTSQ